MKQISSSRNEALPIYSTMLLCPSFFVFSRTTRESSFSPLTIWDIWQSIQIKSATDIALSAPRPDGCQRIWNNFINRLDHSGVKAHIDKLKDKVDMLSAHELNGREIRNAIQTATLLPQFRGQTLGPRHLKEVIKVSNEFEQYLTDFHGHSSSERARVQGTRAD